MTKCFSFTASRDWWYRYTFSYAGLKSVTTNLGEGTTMHCWIPKIIKPAKPNILIHGFGANAMWQWGNYLRPLIPRFNVYVPDLLFFGESYTTHSERTEHFQAQCLKKLMESFEVQKMSLVGVSYGGFVGYSLASQYPDTIEKVVLCCSGVCLEEKDMKDGLFKVSDLDEAASILLPQTPDKLRTLVKMSFVKPAAAKSVPSYFIRDFIQVMCTHYIEEKRDLIQNILKDRQCSNLPKMNQPTLIVWGEEDQVFPLELGYRLQRHLGDNAEPVVIKNAGHAVNLEKTKEFLKHLKAFLTDKGPAVHDQNSHNSVKDHINGKNDGDC
ncbi:hypothetical protein C5167_008206 [Papaver somniferum]|uniref:AB hydrolase-1 domain-containing protein n=1 Tax=Papaver somniferum TaxID=3469 RepID=A0A4Y7JXQ2_PAPSO|nr:uncharacterized protein LOC113285380 isoform X1 [Papaver somniferum]RZC64509.1 hypothetical protein C5167_008206 [Papaver somniferum]